MTKEEAFDNLTCDETSFEITISYYRQVNKNREMAIEMYKTYITKLLDESY